MLKQTNPNVSIVVRARMKAFDHLPAWVLCCKAMTWHMRKAAASGEVLEIRSDRSFYASVECPWCGRVDENIKHMQLANDSSLAIFADTYDFDEGIECLS
jgi:hypothetical protein